MAVDGPGRPQTIRKRTCQEEQSASLELLYANRQTEEDP